jgi:hypothetical protein
MGVSSQNMEIVVYATENDVPIVVPVFAEVSFALPWSFSRTNEQALRISGQFAASTS